MDSSFEFGGFRTESDPFSHFYSDTFLSEAIAASLLEHLEEYCPWTHERKPGFLELRNTDLRAHSLPAPLAFIITEDFNRQLRESMESLVGEPLAARVDIHANKMLARDWIGIHNDFGETGQGYRLVVQLNRGWTVPDGGLLLMLDSATAAEPTPKQRMYLPRHRSAVVFPISANSYHAVTPVVRGCRLTMSYSFYRLDVVAESRG